MRKAWNKEEDKLLVKLLSEGCLWSEITQQLGKSMDSCQNRARRLKLKPSSRELLLHSEEQRDQSLQLRYKQLLKLKAIEERILEDFKSKIVPFTPNISTIYKKESSGTKESAVLLLSDTHIGQVVLPQRTLGFGNYNPRVYLQRLFFLEKSLLSILVDKVKNPLKDLHIFLLGDMVHGNLNHGAEKEETELLANQFQLAVWSLSQMIIRITSALGIPVNVHCCDTGNHGRWQNQKKMPTANRFSNFDHLVYSSIQAICHQANLENLKINVSEQPGAIVDIQGVTFLARHGDFLKGGDTAFGVPVHSMARDVLSSTLRQSAFNQKQVDYFLVGDKHKVVQLPLATGSYIINGAFSYIDDFALAQNLVPVEPIQLLFGVHPKYRKTWSYEVRLQYADALPNKLPYDFPDSISSLVNKYK